MSAEPAYEFVDGITSDLAFVARGETAEAVFVAAAEALLAAALEHPETLEERVERAVVLEEPDLELLMLRWLNELVYLRDAEDLLLRPRRVSLQTNEHARLEAELVGEPVEPSRHRFATDVKAATAHGLHVGHGARGWEARVTLDV